MQVIIKDNLNYKTNICIMNKKEVGTRIKAYMKENGLTQNALAAEFNISQSYISAMINGDKDTLKLAVKLSERYGVSLDWLTGDSGDNIENESDIITDQGGSNTISNNYQQRFFALYNKLQENEDLCNKLMLENEEIRKQLKAVFKLMKGE